MLFKFAVLPLFISLAGSAVAAPHGMDASLMVRTINKTMSSCLPFFSDTQEGMKNYILSFHVILTRRNPFQASSVVSRRVSLDPFI
jgi:hypothetical protein